MASKPSINFRDRANLQLNSFLRAFYVVKSPIYVVLLGYFFCVKVKSIGVFFRRNGAFTFHLNKAPSKP